MVRGQSTRPWQVSPVQDGKEGRGPHLSAPWPIPLEGVAKRTHPLPLGHNTGVHGARRRDSTWLQPWVGAKWEGPIGHPTHPSEDSWAYQMGGVWGETPWVHAMLGEQGGRDLDEHPAP